uniref:(northern house mosquito) hypothetical protein n=1 Tax=Culex pipiens TaxID=7175 RepID=A0A8D8AFB8_CULPI
MRVTLEESATPCEMCIFLSRRRRSQYCVRFRVHFLWVRFPRWTKATDLRRHRFARPRHNGQRMVVVTREKRKVAARERKREAAAAKGRTTKEAQIQKHELTLRECKKKRKHQFWIDEETFHTQTVIKSQQELCASRYAI